MLKVTGCSFCTTCLSKEEELAVSSKGLTEFLSLPCSLPQPPFYCGEKHCWNTHVGRWTRKGFSVSNAFDSEMWALSTALPVCLSCLINSSFLAKETLIRGHYVLSWITCHEGLQSSCLQFILPQMVAFKKLLPSKKCFLNQSIFFSLKCKSLTVFLALCIYMTLFIWCF